MHTQNLGWQNPSTPQTLTEDPPSCDWGLLCITSWNTTHVDPRRQAVLCQLCVTDTEATDPLLQYLCLLQHLSWGPNLTIYRGGSQTNSTPQSLSIDSFKKPTWEVWQQPRIKFPGLGKRNGPLAPSTKEEERRIPGKPVSLLRGHKLTQNRSPQHLAISPMFSFVCFTQ